MHCSIEVSYPSDCDRLTHAGATVSLAIGLLRRLMIRAGACAGRSPRRWGCLGGWVVGGSEAPLAGWGVVGTSSLRGRQNTLTNFWYI
jgi:hypothetical protein